MFYDPVFHCRFYSGCYFLNPVCFLIVHKNESRDFIALHFLGPSINLWDYVDSGMPKYVENSFNECLSPGFWIHSMFGLLSPGIEYYELGVPMIPIPIQRLHCIWDYFSPASLYKLAIWPKKRLWSLLFHNVHLEFQSELINVSR